MSPRLGSADVGADVAAARRLTKKPALDKRFEKRAARLGFEVPQALCLTLGERQARHLEVLASNPLHDRVNRMNRMSRHAVSAATLDSISVNWPYSSCQTLTPAERAKRVETSSAISNER
jgi:hypothetical protein